MQGCGAACARSNASKKAMVPSYPHRGSAEPDSSARAGTDCDQRRMFTFDSLKSSVVESKKDAPSGVSQTVAFPMKRPGAMRRLRQYSGMKGSGVGQRCFGGPTAPG